MPVAVETNRYEHWKILALPTFQDGIFTDSWKRADIPVRHYLRQGSYHIPFRKEELVCLQGTTELPCRLCLKPEVTVEINECTKAILEETNALETCEIQHLTNITDQILRVNKTTWAFVDSNPGEITEICDHLEPRMRKLDLPHAGIISINPDCQYTMVNTPVTIEEIDDDMNVVVSTRNEVTYRQYNPLEDSIFRHHLKTNSLWYFLSFCIFLLFTCCGILVYCICYNGKIRVGFQHVADPRRNAIALARNLNRNFEMPLVQFTRRGGIEFIN
jgi:hypothetical protein